MLSHAFSARITGHWPTCGSQSANFLEPRRDLGAANYCGLYSCGHFRNMPKPIFGSLWLIYDQVVRGILLAIISVLMVVPADAVRVFVVVEEPLAAQRVEGVALDPTGAPISGLTVSDCSPNWAGVLRETTTDSNGRFRFSRRQGKSIYFLRFDHPNFNPLGLRLKLDVRATQRGIVARPDIGG
jgi:hypothetical protein